MKPKNQQQRDVIAASKKLPPITKEQIQWGYRNCILHVGRRTKKGVITCTGCTHEWTDKEAKDKCTCPHCGLKLKIEDTRDRTFFDYEYLCIITTCEGYQVLRFLYIESNLKVGQEAEYSHIEAVQRWIAPDGSDYTFARLRPMGYFVKGWSYCSHLELRNRNDDKYNIIPTKVFPKQQIIPELKKKGYKMHFHRIHPYRLFKTLLTDNKAETLFKTGQISLMLLFLKDQWRKIEKYWPSIRIAIRNGYKVKDASLWCDYIDTLHFFNKDLRNAKYVCPVDLHREHDRYMHKKAVKEARREKEENLQEMLKKEANYRAEKAPFFGLQFSDGLVRVRVIESVEEMKMEGKLLHHCVGGYHSKKDSLILSATVEGKRTETVELSLSGLEVIQCRGACNKNTKYHSRIIRLVENNLPVIQARMAI